METEGPMPRRATGSHGAARPAGLGFRRFCPQAARPITGCAVPPMQGNPPPPPPPHTVPQYGVDAPEPKGSTVHAAQQEAPIAGLVNTAREPGCQRTRPQHERPAVRGATVRRTAKRSVHCRAWKRSGTGRAASGAMASSADAGCLRSTGKSSSAALVLQRVHAKQSVKQGNGVCGRHSSKGVPWPRVSWSYALLAPEGGIQLLRVCARGDENVLHTHSSRPVGQGGPQA